MTTDSSPSPHLIAHLVRGLPAFDIAIPLGEGTPTDPGPWWIIPTSGHRAYPYWHYDLLDLLYLGCLTVPPPALDWPDYIPTALPSTLAPSLATRLGLSPPPTITRR